MQNQMNQPIKRFYKTILLTFLLTAMLACNKDDGADAPQDQGPDPTSFAQNFGNALSRDFLGRILDTNGNPIEEVQITIGNSSATTDANGIFIINDATVNERFAYVKASKAGFIHASRALVPSEGTNNIHIVMLPELTTATITSGNAETVSLANGASVEFEGNYSKPDGSPYTGNVNVILHHLDPSDDNMVNQMPGMLYASNSQNEERLLQTYGMLAVELRGTAGEELNIAEGSSAEIIMPLDPSLMGNAPNTIPLWYFDEEHGYWIEEGEATLAGNAYVGTVTHFSFWNCDIPAEAANVCLTVMDTSNNPISNLNVVITSNTYGSRSGNTNALGQVCGFLPSNESLTLEVFNSFNCSGGSIYSASVGPFTNDAAITITLDNADIISETVVGTFNDCSGDAITQGYVQVTHQGQLYTDMVADGNFEIHLARCSNDDAFTVKAIDYINIQETDALNYTFTTPLTNLGTIQACNAIEEFITYQKEGFPQITYNLNIQCGLDGDILFINYVSENQQYVFNFDVSDFDGVGSYSQSYLNYFDENLDGTTLEQTLEGTTNVSAFGAVGEYIDLNFSGVIQDLNSPEAFPITGTMHVLRDY